MSGSGKLVRRAFAAYLAVALAVGIAVSASAVWIADAIARDDLLADAEETARLVQGAVVASLERDPARSIGEHFTEVLLPQVQAGTLVRVKVWERAGADRLRLIYSDLPAVIGQEKAMKPGRAELIGTSRTLVLPVPDDRAHATEFRPGRELVEVFTAFHSDGRDFLLESYLETATAEKAARLRGHLLPVLLGGMAVFAVAALPLAAGLARRLSRVESERSALIERAASEHEHERTRLGQRLHDGVVQDLAGASMALSVLAGERRPDSDRIEAVAGILRRDVQSLRVMLDDLVPADLAWPGLEAALAELAEDTHIDATVSVAAFPVADRAASVFLYRSARELLRNVERHAGARSVRISARCEDGVARLSVTDDGRGFDPVGAAKAGHMGLRIVDHASRAAGGSLEIASTPGAGTRVTVRVASMPQP